MKQITSFILSTALIVCLAGCTSNSAITALETETVLETETLTVTQQGRIITVTDSTSGEQYTFTQHRVKRPQNATETQRRMIARTAVATDTMTIQTVHDLLIVTVKDKQSIIHHYYIQP